MGRYCTVLGCKSTKEQPGISFHRFPPNQKLRNKWVAKIGSGSIIGRKERVKDKVNIHMVVCSRHFVSTDFTRPGVGKVPRLKKTAVPSQFNMPGREKKSQSNCWTERKQRVDVVQQKCNDDESSTSSEEESTTYPDILEPDVSSEQGLNRELASDDTASTSNRLITISSDVHRDKLANGLWKHFLAKCRLDCDIKYREQSVRLHRVMLDIFLAPEPLPADDGGSSGAAPQSGEKPERDCLEMMVEFMYLGRVDVPPAQIQALLTVATESKFQLLVDAIRASFKPKTKQATSAGAQQQNSAKVGQSGPAAVSPAQELSKSVNIAKNIHLVLVKDPGTRSILKPKSSPVVTTAAPTGPAPGQFRVLKHRLVFPGTQPDGGSGSSNSPTKASDAAPAVKELFFCKFPSCDKAYHTSKGLDRHFTCHYAAHKCEHCPKAFRSYNGLLGHLKLKHKEAYIAQAKQIFYCKWPSCDKAYSNTRDLDRHAQGHYSMHKCQHCPKEFRTPVGLQGHIKFQHSGPLMCDQCPKISVNESALKMHKFIRHSAKIHKCNYCDMTFTTLTFLNNHQKYKHLGHYHMCDQCGRKFNDMRNLRRHVEIHSEVKSHQCTHCPKAYNNYNALRAHVQTHGEKRHQCQFCHKRFILKGSLNYHLKSHGFNANETGKRRKT